MDDKNDGWIDVVGILIVTFILITIALVSAGGWTWYAKFLEGSAANWVQAVGSIVAILAAGRFLRTQITANQDALVVAKKIEESAEAERRRLKKRELLVALEDVLSQINYALEDLPIATATSTAQKWTFIRRELERLTKSLERIQGTEVLGTNILKNVNLVGYTVSVVHQITVAASGSRAPVPLSEDAKKFYVGKIDEILKDVRAKLWKMSGRDVTGRTTRRKKPVIKTIYIVKANPVRLGRQKLRAGWPQK